MRQVYILTEATTEPVTMDEIKAYVGYNGSDAGAEATLYNLALAARLRLEEFCGRNFAEKTMVLTINKVPSRLALPYGPINAITSIQVYDEDNNVDSTLVSGTDYHLMLVFDRYIRFDSLSMGEYLKVTYTAGYKSDGHHLPEAIKRAILTQTKFDFNNRSGSGTTEQVMLSNEAKNLLAPYRVYEV